MSGIVEDNDYQEEIDRAINAILHGDDRSAYELLDVQDVPTNHPYFTDFVNKVEESSIYLEI